MILSISFCLERAEEWAEEARRSDLVNVRERAQRSEEAWRKMASRAIQIEEARARKAAEAALIRKDGDDEPDAGQAN